jgi:hypothetical protein
MEKIFKQKIFNYFVWTPLGSRVNIYKLVQLTRAANLPLVSLMPCRWQLATGVVDSGGKFAAGIVDTGGKFATGINNTSETGGKICPRCR